MDINSETLKDKLNAVIRKRMLTMKQGKTEAINAIAVPLDVQPRQIYKWLKEESFPYNAESIALTLDGMNSDVASVPALKPTSMNFPFRLTINKNTLKVTQDDYGNVIVNGSLSLDLL